MKLEKITEEVREAVVITSADKVKEILNHLEHAKQESFYVLNLDGANKVISARLCHVGTATSCQLHPRDIFKAAIAENAVGIIAVHNHPSGSLTPSLEDGNVTDRLKDAGKLLGIKLLDHIIVSRKGYYSFCEENRI